MQPEHRIEPRVAVNFFKKGMRDACAQLDKDHASGAIGLRTVSNN